MKFKNTLVTIIIMLLGGFSLSYGSDSDYPIPRKIDIGSDNSRGDGDCTSCIENYDAESLGAVCCDQASEYYSCSDLETNNSWNCSGCECINEPDFVSMYGCTDPSATNYEGAVIDYGVCWSPDLTAEPGVTEISLDWVPYGTICEDESACTYGETLSGCVYAEVNEDCDGNCIVETDCAGVCGGSAVVDECGVCDGDGAVYACGCADMPDGDCDCSGNVDDCFGDCGGDAYFDACGTCDNYSSNDCYVECDGEFDDCGMCTGEGTGLEYNYAMDCLGVCPGAAGYIDAQEDECGVCQGPGAIYECGCADMPAGDCDCNGRVDDCLGDCGGSAVEDECGVCDGGGKGTCAISGDEVCNLEECTIYYNVYRMEDGVDDEYGLLTGPITGTEFTETGFVYINTFSYQVTYIDGWGHEG